MTISPANFLTIFPKILKIEFRSPPLGFIAIPAMLEALKLKTTPLTTKTNALNLTDLVTKAVYFAT